MIPVHLLVEQGLVGLPMVEDGDRHAPRALPRDAPVKSARRPKSTSPRYEVNLAEILRQPRRDTTSIVISVHQSERDSVIAVIRLRPSSGMNFDRSIASSASERNAST